MEGRDLSAGAVAGVKHVKHPIDAAYAVKTLTEHVMLTGEGADQFAAENGIETIEDNMYFATPKTMRWVEEFKARSRKNGTVGCVVFDKEGNLSAGTYADNAGVAVSCTGHGEYFIRHTQEIIFGELNSEAGNGGLIAVDKYGNFTLDFNSTGMFRGYLYRDKGSDTLNGGVGIFKEMRIIGF